MSILACSSARPHTGKVMAPLVLLQHLGQSSLGIQTGEAVRVAMPSAVWLSTKSSLAAQIFIFTVVGSGHFSTTMWDVAAPVRPTQSRYREPVISTTMVSIRDMWLTLFNKMEVRWLLKTITPVDGVRFAQHSSGTRTK